MNSGNKVSKILLIFLGLIIISIFFYRYLYLLPAYKKYGVYTIGTVYKREGGGKGGGFYLRYSYNYNSINYKGRTIILQHWALNKKYKGKKFLVELISNNPSKSNININYPVPDSIKTAPPEGWKKLPSWAKKKNDEE